MEDATSLFALKEESNIRKQPLDVMSYSDVLRSMDPVTPLKPATEPPPPSSPPAPQYAPPAPQYAPPAPPQYAPPAPPDNTPPTVDIKQFQNEMIVLLGSYIVIHMSTVQEWMRSKIPNIVSPETGAMSVLGLVTNGVLLIVLWNVAKRLILKYMQDI